MFSFYDWCITNGKEKYLLQWDFEKNAKQPEIVSHDDHKKYYFKCPNGHDSFLKGIHNLINSKDLVCPICNSFYTWCIQNNKQYLIDAWCESNGDIQMISKGSGKHCLFSFDKTMPPVSESLCSITGNRNVDPREKFENTLGYYMINTYGEDSIQKYWSNLNDKTPFDYSKCSTSQVFFKCSNNNHDDYLQKICNFVNSNHNCPYCASKRVCSQDSFAQYHIDNTDSDFLDKYWAKSNIINPYEILPQSNKKITIQCQNKDYHQYQITAAGFTNGDRCPYCRKTWTKAVHPNDSLGALFPQILNIWSDKNEKSPYEYRPYSKQYVWIKCHNGIHEDKYKKVSDITAKDAFECSECYAIQNGSKLQRKVTRYVESLGYTLKHEHNCNIVCPNPATKHNLPYDNEIVELKAIIEVHGRQHYETSGLHYSQAKYKNITPDEEFEYRKGLDKMKKEYAINNGYYYIEIPYWSDDKDETYKRILDEEIQHCKNA